MMGEGAVLLENFAAPPPGYGPVPFWWWVGGTLDTARLCWQLDELRAKGVFSAIISYNHHADGSTNVGDPAIFSEAWWTIFLAVLDHARAYGMTLGMQDYSLLKPLLKGIGEAEPALRGLELRHVACEVSAVEPCALTWPADATLVEVSAWAEKRTIDLVDYAVGNALHWKPETGTWQVAAIYAVPTAFDPLHPESGARSLAAFQQMIAARIGDHLGTTLTMFFQDELDFGARWPFWSAGLFDAFEAKKGYQLSGRLAELWCDRGPATTKLRLDFADVAVGLLEAHYFAPVHRWHEAHGCLFGHDNAGRGAIAVGRDYYGDYMRTMRWYSAPGSDDPDLRGERAFKGLKVASSIATLNDRARVWAECFHSSGWGATPAEMVDGINGVFALGATLINLHGLYYTTAGSWWEWAPPDFHFRQPYWACMGAFNAYATRLSWLLSQGCHVCDVAILYPSSAIAGGLNAEVDPALAGPIPLSEAQRFEAQPPVDAAEASAFAVARALFADAVDFDFIDDASLAGARIGEGYLAAGGGRWRTILLPHMTTINWDSLCQLRAFAEDGGRVVALGGLPRASDRAGLGDETLDAVVASMFGPGGTCLHFPDADVDFLAKIVPPAERQVRVVGPAVQVLHRRIDAQDIWFVRNPDKTPAEVSLVLRGTGAAWLLNAFTGEATALASTTDAGTGRVNLSIPEFGAAVVLLDPTAPAHASSEPPPPPETIVTLESGWRFTLTPTMDNRFGDFAAPSGLVGADVRRFEWCEGEMPHDNSVWQLTAPGHAPRLLLLGPVTDDNVADWEAAVASTPSGAAPPPLRLGTTDHAWRDYAFSFRDGLLDDPFLKHWASGPHGLKDAVPDDYIDLEGAPGDTWYLITTLHVTTPGDVRIVAGSRAAYRLWADGTLRINQRGALPPGRLPEWGLPHYDAPPRETVVAPCASGTRVVLRITQPEGQRTRAHIGLAETPRPADRKLRWFADGVMKLKAAEVSHPRQWLRFSVPPGVTRLDLHHQGTVLAWRDGSVMTITSTAQPDGTTRSRIFSNTEAKGPTTVLLSVNAPCHRAGDCLLAPIELVDPDGPIMPGDWAGLGLPGYSGGIAYSCDFFLKASDIGRTLAVETGPIHVAATIILNGEELGCVFSAPWCLMLGKAARTGRNHLEIRVFNTLANHYDQATPTPYVFSGQTVSGLLQAPRIVAR
jgi:alpha-L-rhamnosidase